MRPLLIAAALLLTCSAASAFPTSIPKGTKVGAACTQPLKTLAPKLQTCAIAGPKKSRVWCPDGTAFELDDEQAPVPLARSLCGLTQTTD